MNRQIRSSEIMIWLKHEARPITAGIKFLSKLTQSFWMAAINRFITEMVAMRACVSHIEL